MAFVAVIPAVGSTVLPALGTALSTGAGLASSLPVVGGTIGSLGSGLGSAMTALGAGNLGAAASSLGSGLLGAGSSLLPTNLLSAGNLLGGLGKSFGIGVNGATPFAGEYSLGSGLGGLLGGVKKIGEVAGAINGLRGGGATPAPGANATGINLRDISAIKSLMGEDKDIQQNAGGAPEISQVNLGGGGPAYTSMTPQGMGYSNQIPAGLAGVGIPGSALQAIEDQMNPPNDTHNAVARSLGGMYGRSSSLRA